MKTTKIACRSETCNVDIINSNTFRLDLTMAGQDCNTQSAVRGVDCQDTWRNFLELAISNFFSCNKTRFSTSLMVKELSFDKKCK